MTRPLALAPELALPLDAVTQTFAFLAKRGAGKTYTAGILVEEFLKAGHQVVVVDPLDVWWGLRAAANGRDPGLPITVLGGVHGDLPLADTDGEILARLIYEERLSVVLSLRHLRKAARTRFLTAFYEALYHLAGERRVPVHLAIDEADASAPQRPMKGEERMLGAMEDIVRRGRSDGLGCSLITQRAAVLNKDVLSQVEVLVALRTIAPQDIAAINAWVVLHGTEAERRELLGSLPSLPIGESWWWSPGWLEIFQRVRVRAKETYDSSRTPKVGEVLAPPKRLAPVDLERLRTQLAQTIERAKAEDPKLLKARIATLEAELRQATAARPGPSPEDLARAREEGAAVEREVWRRRWALLRPNVSNALEPARQVVRGLERLLEASREEAPPPAPVVSALTHRIRAQQRGLAGRPTKEVLEDLKPTAGMVSRPNAGEPPLGAERKLLVALAARHPDGLTRAQLGTLSGYAAGGGTFRDYLSRLRRLGYLDESGDRIRASAEGLAAAGPVERRSTPDELQAMWRAHLGAERQLLDVLIAAWPTPLSREALGAQAGYEASGGTFRDYLSRLRRNGLLDETRDGIRVVSTLMED
ncbi:MAG TPA: DUF87 domain-containing protein [Thermodesulfobacteriota bacterium]